MAVRLDPFGDQIPHCEPPWYQGYHTTHYGDSHVRYRAAVRDFVDKEILPHAEEWVKTGYPKELHRKAYEAGVSGILYPESYGGTLPGGAQKDMFHELILWDEVSRETIGALGQLSINSMAMPPILAFGSQLVKDKVVRSVATGIKDCSLAISEPTAGSDVANIKTTAVDMGDHYLVNGQKKWITGGLIADFFTLVVRTGNAGRSGLSLLLLERHFPGVHIRKMHTTGDSSHSTSFITLEDVKIPKENLIGEVGQGFKYILLNFNHERWVIACQAVRQCRDIYADTFKYAMKRKTFGVTLMEHQAIRIKFAEMARQFEALHAMIELVALQYSCGVPDSALGGMCALLKVNASRTFEYCAHQCAHVYGGASLVKEGQGRMVERAQRGVTAVAIPGGAEDIVLDLAVRQAIGKAQTLVAQQQAKL